MAECPTCKTMLPDDASFCPHDGTTLPPDGRTVPHVSASPPDARTMPFWKAPAPGETLLGRYRTVRPRGPNGPGCYIDARDIVAGETVLVQVFSRPRGDSGTDRRTRMRERSEEIVSFEHPGVIPLQRAAED